MRIVIVPNEKGTPVGKLADAELHFDRRDGQLLDGLKLIGFAVWESQWPTKHPRHPHLRVTLPARKYTVNGEERSFNLLRPVQDTQVRGVEAAATAALSAAILDAYEQAFAQAMPTVAAAAAMARQVWAVAEEPPPARPQPAPRGVRRVDTPRPEPLVRRATANGGRYPLARPTSRPAPEPPPHTDDDYPF